MRDWAAINRRPEWVPFLWRTVQVRAPDIPPVCTLPSCPSLPLFELFRRQLMPREELVEVRPVALRQPGRLTHVAAGDLQDLRQVAAGELIARLIEGGEAPG